MLQFSSSRFCWFLGVFKDLLQIEIDSKCWMITLLNIGQHFVILCFFFVSNQVEWIIQRSIAFRALYAIDHSVRIHGNVLVCLFLYLPNIIYLIIKFVKQYVNYEHTNGGYYELKRKRTDRRFEIRAIKCCCTVFSLSFIFCCCCCCSATHFVCFFRVFSILFFINILLCSICRHKYFFRTPTAHS